MIKLRKNSISYLVWVLYVLFAGTLFSFMGMTAATELGFHKHWSSCLFVLLIFALVFIVSQGVYAIPFGAKSKPTKNNKVLVIESIFVMSLLVIGLLLRIFALSHMEAPTQNVGFFKYFNNALVSGVWVQIAIQLVGTVFYYLSVRRLAGAFASILAFGLLMVAPRSVSISITYSYEILYFTLFCFSLFLITCYLSAYTRNRNRLFGLLVFSVVIGALIGFMIFTEGVSIILLIPMLAVYGVKNSNRRWYVKFTFMNLSLCAVICAYAGMLYLYATYAKTNITLIFAKWLSLFWPEGFNYRIFFNWNNYELWILFAIMVFGIFSFTRRHEDENYSPWVLMMFGFIAFNLFGMLSENMESGFVFFAIVCVVAGLSIQEMFNFSRMKETAEDTMIKDVHDIAPETVVAAIEQINQEADKQEGLDSVEEEPVMVDKRKELFEAVENQEMLDAVETKPADVAPSDEISITEVHVNEEVVAVEVEQVEVEPVDVEPVVSEETTTVAAPTPDPTPEPVVLIENVLPLPKKHVKKTFEYQYDISAELMEFDHEVSEDDDFDI